MSTTIPVTIWHRVDSCMFFDWDFYPTPALERAYEYEIDQREITSESEPHAECFRQNNAVDGSERNCIAQKRSLSVGDVVQIGRHVDEATFWSAESVGWRTISREEAIRAVARGKVGMPGKPNAGQINPVTGEFWVNELGRAGTN